MDQKGLVRQHESLISIIRQVIDILIVTGSLWLCSVATTGLWGTNYEIAALSAAILFYLFARHEGLYHSWRGESMLAELSAVFRIWTGVLLVQLLAAYTTKTSAEFSRQIVGAWIIVAPSMLMGIRIIIRIALRHSRASGHNFRRVAIAGAGDLGIVLAQRFESSPWMGINVEAFYDDQPSDNFIDADNSIKEKLVGNLDQLIFDAKTGNYDEVYVALPMRAEKQMKNLIRSLSDCSVQVHYVPDIFTFNLLNSRVHDMAGIPTISVYDSPLDVIGRMLKRAEDLIIGTMILFLISIPMVAIALAIKITSPGPVFFKQRRYGLNSEEILVWKFRSMTVCEDGASAVQATKNDARITPVGSFIRKTSLDELPQFINVIQGTMSIVGPRPHPISLNEQFRTEIEGYMLRHLVKPGITGWAQVNGWRGETDTKEKMEKRVEHDLHYVRNWSIWLDLKIIFMTIFKGFIHKNAY